MGQGGQGLWRQGRLTLRALGFLSASWAVCLGLLTLCPVAVMAQGRVLPPSVEAALATAKLPTYAKGNTITGTSRGISAQHQCRDFVIAANNLHDNHSVGIHLAHDGGVFLAVGNTPPVHHRHAHGQLGAAFDGDVAFAALKQFRLEQVGDHDGHAPAHSHHAVHQHVRLLPGLLDELERLFEVPPDLVVLAVLRRDVEVERHLLRWHLAQLAAIERVELWAYPGSGPGAVTMDGWQGILDLSRCHEQALRLLGLTAAAPERCHGVPDRKSVV